MGTTFMTVLSEATVHDLVVSASSEPLLDEADEAALVRKVRAGDLRALERLVMGNLRVAVDEAIRHRGFGVPQSRLVRTGVSALMEAARSYRQETHGSFSTFAAARVREALSRDAKLS
jgi:RNA polymerase primary sigma factor